MGFNNLSKYSVETYPLTAEIYKHISRDTLRALIDQVLEHPTNQFGFKTITNGLQDASQLKKDLPDLVGPLLGKSYEKYVRELFSEKAPRLSPANKDHEAILEYYRKIVTLETLRSLGETRPERHVRFASLTSDFPRQRETAAILLVGKMKSRGAVPQKGLPLGLLQDLSRGIRKRIETTPQLISLLPDLAQMVSSVTQTTKPMWYENPEHPQGQFVAGVIRSLAAGQKSVLSLSESAQARVLDFGRKTGILEAGLPRDVYATVQQALTSLMKTRETGDVEAQNDRLRSSKAFYDLGRKSAHFDMQNPSDSTEMKMTTSIREVMTDIQKHYAQANDKGAVAIIGTALWAFKKGIDKAADDVIEGDGDMIPNRLIPPAWLQKKWNSHGSFDEAVTRHLRNLSHSAKTILGVIASEAPLTSRHRGQAVQSEISPSPSMRQASGPRL